MSNELTNGAIEALVCGRAEIGKQPFRVQVVAFRLPEKGASTRAKARASLSDGRHRSSLFFFSSELTAKYREAPLERLTILDIVRWRYCASRQKNGRTYQVITVTEVAGAAPSSAVCGSPELYVMTGTDVERAAPRESRPSLRANDAPRIPHECAAVKRKLDSTGPPRLAQRDGLSMRNGCQSGLVEEQPNPQHFQGLSPSRVDTAVMASINSHSAETFENAAPQESAANRNVMTPVASEKASCTSVSATRRDDSSSIACQRSGSRLKLQRRRLPLQSAGTQENHSPVNCGAVVGSVDVFPVTQSEMAVLAIGAAPSAIATPPKPKQKRARVFSSGGHSPLYSEYEGSQLNNLTFGSSMGLQVGGADVSPIRPLSETKVLVPTNQSMISSQKAASCEQGCDRELSSSSRLRRRRYVLDSSDDDEDDKGDTPAVGSGTTARPDITLSESSSSDSDSSDIYLSVSKPPIQSQTAGKPASVVQCKLNASSASVICLEDSGTNHTDPDDFLSTESSDEDDGEEEDQLEDDSEFITILSSDGEDDEEVDDFQDLAAVGKAGPKLASAAAAADEWAAVSAASKSRSAWSNQVDLPSTHWDQEVVNDTGEFRDFCVCSSWRRRRWVVGRPTAILQTFLVSEFFSI